MYIIQVNSNDPTVKELEEVNHNMQLKHNETRDGIADKDQGLSDEGESHTNGDVDDVSDKHMEVVQVHAHTQTVMQRPQEKPQRSSVSWKRFLPYPSLKVLLVENDNSTRHVVNALLRNCGYEVTAVENGQEAWRILQDLTNHINIVLTEVVMPCLSGIGLLCKIMNHKTCKNIPVIMMSSHDSINIVFKCLSKGAVDFLVKPIRKNELKNLWQHVWRKCHSSSGSGSESCVRTQNSTKSKGAEDSDENTSCNDGADIGSTGLNVRDGSDNGSGTQSFWVKGTVDVESPKPMSPWDQSADPPDSTCAQVIHLTPEALGDKWVPITTEKECEGQDDEPENVPLGKDLEIGVPRISNVHLEGPNKVVAINMVGNSKDILLERNPKKETGEQKHEGRVELVNEKPDENLMNMATDLPGAVPNNSYPQIDNNIPKFLSDGANKKDKFINGTKEMPSLKLSLKRHRDTGDSGTVVPDHNGLRHSDLSAFTRYNSSSTANQVPIANVGSCSPLDCSSDAAKESNSNNTPPNQLSNGSNNNNDMGSTTNNGFSKPALFSDKPAAKPTAQHLESYSAFQPVQYSPLSFSQPAVQHNKSEAVANNTKWSHARGNMKQQQVQVQHHHHHYHHHHHHVHNMQQQQQQQQQQQPADPDDMNLKNMAAAAPQCGSSNTLSVPIDRDGSNQNLNGSASGSGHGSNAQNGSSTAVNPRALDVESDNGIGEKCGTSVVGVENRVSSNKSCLAQREVALNKYRQKRKERCFEKKVRYQSRKKLAEQRPRVRGQFVRQAAQEIKEKKGCS